MRKIALITCLLLFNLACAQKNNSEKKEDFVHVQVKSFLEKNKFLDENSAASLITVEALRTSLIEPESIGVYIIGAHVSHSPRFILLKKRDKMRILDQEDVNTSFKVLLDFLNEYVDSEEEKIKYILKVSTVFKENLKYNLAKTDYIFDWKTIR